MAYIIKVQDAAGNFIGHELGIQYDTEDKAKGALDVLTRLGENRPMQIGRTVGRPPGAKNKPKPVLRPLPKKEEVRVTQEQVAKLVGSIRPSPSKSGEYVMDLSSLRPAKTG